MFGNLLETKYFEDIMKVADTQIKKDRDVFEPIYNDILLYCSKNDIIISELHFILDFVKSGIQEKGFQLYCKNPGDHAKKIADLIFKHGDYTISKTINVNEEYNVSFNMRTVAMLYALEDYKQVSLFKLVSPLQIDYGHKISAMPPEIELIDIYRQLYLPEFADQWCDIVKAENPLLQKVFDRIESGVIGGVCKNNRLQIVENLKMLILHDFLKDNNNYVLVGDWALLMIDETFLNKNFTNTCTQTDKLQLITQNDIRDDMALLKTFIEKHTKYEITYKKQDLHIPKDFRVKRYTIYLRLVGDKGVVEKPLMDLFNSAQFELIPYVAKNNMKIGNAFVIMRFFLIDLWIIRIVEKLNLIPRSALQTRINQLSDYIKKIRMSDYMNQVFQKDYFGKYYDFNIAKKIENLKGRYQEPYIPYQAESSSGE